MEPFTSRLIEVCVEIHGGSAVQSCYTKPQGKCMNRGTAVAENRHCVQRRSFGISTLFAFSTAVTKSLKTVFSLMVFHLFH